MPGRWRSDACLLRRAQADGHELIDGGALAVEDAECAVPGTGQGTGLVDHVAEEDGELEIRLQQHGRLDDPGELDGIIDRVERHHASA